MKRLAAVILTGLALALMCAPALAGYNPYNISAPSTSGITTPSPQVAEVYADWFYKSADGTDKLPELNRAKTYLEALSPTGGNIILGTGYYNLSAEFDEDQNGIWLIGQTDQSTVLVPTTANMTVVRLAASGGGLKNVAIANNNSLSGITGVRLAPVNESGMTPLSIINNNIVDNIDISGTLYGIVFRTGPKVSGADSEAYFNHIQDIVEVNVVVGMWFENTATNPDPGAGANSNTIINFNDYSAGSVSNTGIEIDQGGSNNFIGGSISGMANGTNPNPPGIGPTGVYIAQADSAGGNNDDNNIISVRMEANTLDWDIRDPLTNGVGVSGLHYSFPNGCPIYWGSSAPSSVPYCSPGLTIDNSGTLSGVNAGESTLTGVNGARCNPGPCISQTYFTSLPGLTGSIANNGTFTITTPHKAIYLLSCQGDYNETEPYTWMVSTDGSTNQGSVSVLTPSGGSHQSITVNGYVITVTNSSGASSHFHWSLMQLNPNF